MAWKPAVIEGRVEPREILNLTVLFDHDSVDGAPATRFVKRLVELIESGYGLDEVDVTNGDLPVKGELVNAR
jgi:pyruvate/2-oxoglutarate dehydrogenase complex dihydrolipoamide acyltransferase (E2) component